MNQNPMLPDELEENRKALAEMNREEVFAHIQHLLSPMYYSDFGRRCAIIDSVIAYGSKKLIRYNDIFANNS